MLEDAWIEPRTVATLALAIRCTNHSARSHDQTCLHYRVLHRDMSTHRAWAARGPVYTMCAAWKYLWSIGVWAAHRLACTKRLLNILFWLQHVRIRLQHAQAGGKISGCNMLERAANVQLQHAQPGNNMYGCNMLEQAATCLAATCLIRLQHVRLCSNRRQMSSCNMLNQATTCSAATC